MASNITIQFDRKSVHISDEQMEEIAKQISEEASAALEEEVLDPELQNIRVSAVQFLSVYQQQVIVLNNILNILDRQKAIREKYNKTRITKKDAADLLEDDYATYVENTNQIKAQINEICSILYPKLFSFQNELNNFLDQEAITIISYNGDLYQVNTKKYMSMLKFDTHKGALSARYTVNQQTLQEAATKLDVSNLDKNQLARVKHGRNSALWRYNYFKKKNPNHTGNSALVLWHDPANMSSWHGMSVSSRGDIEEAYAAIILQRHESSFTSDIIEDILEIFMRQYVGNVDNLSGMLEGDVTVGNIEYAIKSANASALGIKQFAELAHQILTVGWSKSDLEAHKKELEEKAKKRNRYYNDMELAAYNGINEATFKGLES